MRAVVVLRLVVLYLAVLGWVVRTRGLSTELRRLVVEMHIRKIMVEIGYLLTAGINPDGRMVGRLGGKVDVAVEVVFHLLLLVFLHVVSREDLRLRWGTFPLRGKCPMVLTCRCRM